VTNHAPIFSVNVDATGVTIEKIDPGHQGYRKASKTVIRRQRDAIELFRKLKADSKGFNGTYCFNFLDTARTFAMLRLQEQTQQIHDNLDRVLAHNGSAKPGAAIHKWAGSRSRVRS